MKLELGSGARPTPGFIHHDRWQHSPHVDVAFDLDEMPWPLLDGSVSHLLALDVFEHLQDGSIQRWMDECWRVVGVNGFLEFRYPGFDNPYSFRDPTHRHLPRHPETWHYWCPDAPGTVWQAFGRYYFGETYGCWWSWQSRVIEHKDIRITLRRPTREELARWTS